MMGLPQGVWEKDCLEEEEQVYMQQSVMHVLVTIQVLS